MELGDKGPAIVLDDADLEKATKLCATGAILHNGQLCFSIERLFVQYSVLLARSFWPSLNQQCRSSRRLVWQSTS